MTSTCSPSTPSSMLLVCKKLCFVRCLSAVALSICMQFLLLAVFLLFVNFHVLHPLQWITQTLGLMCSFYTWFSSIPLLGAVVLYGLLLGKSHLSAKRYYASRFQWLLGTALRKLIFLAAHVLVGLLTAWLYARYLHVDYRNMIFKCYGDTLCLNNRYTFLICVGITAGLYHFVKENLRQEPHVQFPIIPELKLVQIRSLLYTTLYKSLLNSFVPTLGLALVYWLLGGVINLRFARLFAVDTDEALDSFFAIAGNVRLLFYAWILSAQILSNMHLVGHFFSIFLAEELHFVVENNPVLASDEAQLTLTDGLAMAQVPIVQSLAARELYAISTSKATTQRQAIFALSLPGGHPYNWNQLSAQCLSLIDAYTEELAASVKNISNIKSTPLFATVPSTSASDAAEKILLRQYNASIGIRRMMAEPAANGAASTNATADATGAAAECKQTSNACARINEQFEQMSRQLENSVRTAFRTVPGLFYMFGEPDGAKTAFLLSDSETIAWLTQGLAGICAASLVEDKYGVVQVRLPQIIKSMLRLKMELDKLNNVNLNGKRLDRNLVTLKNAVKRSLYKICTVFGDYLRDLVEEPEDLRNLQCFLCYKDA